MCAQISTPWPAVRVSLHSYLLLPVQQLQQQASGAAAPLHPAQPFLPPACTRVTPVCQLKQQLLKQQVWKCDFTQCGLEQSWVCSMQLCSSKV